MTANSKSVEHLSPGCVVEYLQNGQPVLGWVVDAMSSRVRLININKRELKLPESRLLPWKGPCYGREKSRQEILDILNERSRQRLELVERIDPMEIWELAQGELHLATPQWFAGLIWEEPDVDRVAAMGRTLLDSKTHFKFSPPNFEVYPEETVKARIVEQEANRKRELLAAHGNAFFKALWESRTRGRAALPELPDDLASELKTLLLTRVRDPEDRDSDMVWKLVRKGLPEDPHLPLLLAQTWGLLADHHNYLLDRADYCFDTTWTAAHAGAIEALQKRFAEERREPEPFTLVSIDAATTRDIDDAFGVTTHDDGWLLHLALACPAVHWEFGSDLDKAVAHRATSLYLPEGTAHMLPEELGIDLYSLQAGKALPSLLLTMELDAAGQLRKITPKITWVGIERNWSYEEVEEVLAGDEAPEMLTQALALAGTLRQRRIAQGAVVIEQPDPQISLVRENDRTLVQIGEKKDTPQAGLIVSEFMILANTAVACWAEQEGLPLLHRTQAIALPKGSAGVWTEPHDIYKVVRGMSASCLEPQPRPHATLAASAYTPVTSPIRRYSDFINVGQLVHYLEKGAVRWDADALDGLASSVSSRLEIVGQVQRFRPRYWKLLYFKQRYKKETWTGTVVDESGNFITLALPQQQVLIRAPRHIFGDKIYPGQLFRVRLGGIDPLNNEIKILEAWEE